MKLITVETFYLIIAAMFAFVAGRIARDRTHPRRWGSAAFWGLLAAAFFLGTWKFELPESARQRDRVVGYAVLAMVALAALRRVERGQETGAGREAREASAERLRNRLFWPALLVPGTAVVDTLVLGRIHWGDVWLIEPKQATLIALGCGALLALAVALRTTRAPVGAPLVEGGRLLQAIGWALILPQMLAALGGIFKQAGVGEVVAGVIAGALPTHVPLVAVAAYCLGMMLFTVCMGNAFAAFAVITGGIGLPLIVQQHHGNPAIMAAIGMLAGYCGTLMTPMAANFNIVPAMLLDLKDKNGVVKAQVPIGLAIFAGNVLLMYLCVFRF